MKIGLSDADRERLGGPEWYDLDSGELLVSEARALKKHTGFRLGPWQTALDELDPDAVAFLIWLARKRVGLTEPAFEDLDFDLGGLRSEAGEGEGNPPAPKTGAKPRAKTST